MLNGELDPVRSPNPAGQVGARDSRSTDLNEGGSQTHRVADADLIFGDMGKGDIFADSSGLQTHAVAGVPEGVVIVQVNADGCAWATMVALCDLVTGESAERYLYGAVHAVAKDGRGPGSALVGDQFGLAGEDCFH